MKDKEHLIVGKVKPVNCEFCGKDTASKEEELTSEVDGCEIYMHKKCYERAKMLVELFEDSYTDVTLYDKD